MSARWAVLLLLLAGCIQTTGGDLVRFSAQARGADGASSFVTPKGYAVTLSKAELFVGALYLNQSNPANYSGETACVLPGLYTGEVRGALTVNVLSTEPQPFPIEGSGTNAPTLSSELWLTEGDINTEASKKVVLSVAGVASRDGTSWPFAADFTIGTNRATPPRNSALPGSNPICRQRLVTPIPTELSLSSGATITLTVDPRAWFQSVEFAELTADPLDASRYRFIDDSATAGQPDIALYNALRSTVGPYAVSITQ